MSIRAVSSFLLLYRMGQNVQPLEALGGWGVGLPVRFGGLHKSAPRCTQKARHFWLFPPDSRSARQAAGAKGFVGTNPESK